MGERDKKDYLISNKERKKVDSGLFMGRIAIALGYLEGIRTKGVTLNEYHKTFMSTLDGTDYEAYSKMHTSVYDFLKKNAKFFKIKVGED